MCGISVGWVGYAISCPCKNSTVSQIKDDFQCYHDCHSQYTDLTNDNYSNACTYDYHHITQSVQDLTDSTQQITLHSMEENALSFADDTDTHCDLSITDHILHT